MKAPASFWQRCRRALPHLRSTAAAARAAFPDASLHAIEQAIAQGEQTHTAEIRLILEASLGIGDIFRDVGNRQRALTLFAQYGVWDTEENCGVLIYVNLAERQVDIVADRNVGRRIAPAEWQAICQTMTQGYAGGAYHDSTLRAIAALNELLRKHFPADGARPNQLPNQAIII
ncbi:TPM domain-containing protein [Janthinobacterium fluminis]|uniref:TPM domain-containing protein n=1 Tax=Janthinobacterium fluminis TaxID=2987524 RepID=A0ABT5K0S3_9BURK|nr:TPM domain-containing protein [Janthinobacterium fluminis]MDC8757362.1 TPM domain-containing protein [Janthinobacterium fluminis]